MASMWPLSFVSAVLQSLYCQRAASRVCELAMYVFTTRPLLSNTPPICSCSAPETGPIPKAGPFGPNYTARLKILLLTGERPTVIAMAPQSR
ncbi:hypothetical protein T492DRAFT_959928 [Pavlovales sp. CCMP2436]|nr:hypothetical protein T492DRAFT_959928 [Pavlovales sp. CCMP2436]